MVTIPFTPGLHHLAGSSWVYLQPSGSWGYSNCGLVVRGEQALLVDTLFTKPLTRRMLDTVTTTFPDAHIATIVTTHANGDHCWGNELLPAADVVGSRATAHGMTAEISPAQLATVVTGTPEDTPLGAYVRHYFGQFDFSGITLRPPSRTFDGHLDLDLRGHQIQLWEVGPAHTAGDVIVHVPDDGVVFAGDILFIEDHPVVWSGPIANLVRACTKIIDTGARFVVPGHGPVTDAAGVASVRSYLEHVAERAEHHYRAGTPYWRAAADMDLPAPFAAWGHRERLVTVVAAVYRDLGWSENPSQLELLRRTAEVWASA